MYTIKLRRDSSVRWARLNPVLADGEPGVERTSDGIEKLKIGDGSTPWNDLDYTSGGGDGSGTGPRGPQGIPGPTGPQGPEGPVGPKGAKGDPGVSGPQGLTGPAGPQGIQGVPGPQGSDGNSFNYRGDWDAVTIFAVDDVVFHTGSSWIARVENTDSEPSGASADWDEIAIAGSPGPPGADGIQGPTGPQGDRGVPGPQGNQGNQGNPGSKGDPGNPGPQGPEGPQGLQGPAGVDGADGPVGPEGPQGLQGPGGPQGPAGADGAQGPQGPQGVPGDQGPAGVDGAQGPQGPSGPAGADGTSFNYRGSWDSATDYLPGDVVFYNGSSWISIVGSTNSEPTFESATWDEIAIQGAQGAPGTDGAQGPQGPQGPAGADGAQGPIGLTGPKGDTGDIGPQGPQGIQGVQGPIGNPAVLVRARRFSDLNMGPSGGWQGPIALSTEDVDTDGFWSGTKFQPTRAGWYRLGATAVFSGAASGALVEVHIAMNATGSVDASEHLVASDLASVRSDGWAIPQTETIEYFNGTTDYAQMYVWIPGSIVLHGTGSTQSRFEVESVGAAGPAGPGTLVTAWQALTLDNGWGNIAGAYAVAQWRQVGDEVQLRGALTKGSGSAVGQQIAHGAPGPPQQLYLRVASVAGDSTIEIYADGSIHVANTAFGSGDLSLNNIRYSTAV